MPERDQGVHPGSAEEGGAGVGDTGPVQGRRREIADLYWASDPKVLDRQDRHADQGGSPFVDLIPDIGIYRQRGSRMLDPILCPCGL